MSLADHLEALNLTRGRGAAETQLLAQVAKDAQALLEEYDRSCVAVGSPRSEVATHLARLLVDLDIVRHR